MELSKIIEAVNIQKEYKTFVEDFISELNNHVGENLHSVYMCGSIPRGEAIPYRSDGDFTIVLKEKDDIRELLDRTKKNLLHKYPYVTKIDTPTCSVEEVECDLYGWGFWIKVISICVFGDDLGITLPAIHTNSALIAGINEDTIQTLNQMIQEYKVIETINEYAFRRRLLKRIIRVLYSFTIIESGYWTDNIEDMKVWIYRFSGADIILMDSVFDAYDREELQLADVMTTIDESFDFIKMKLRTL